MKTVVISRQDRPERLKRAQEQFVKYGIGEADVFDAFIEIPGWKGCRDSHLGVLEKYKEEDTLLVFEDDVEFLIDPSEPVAESLWELPRIWDLLYLGINPQEKFDRFSDHLFRARKGYCAHAIIYNNTQRRVVPYILNNRGKIQKYDVFLSNIVNEEFVSFVVYPLVCTQWQHSSDTCQRTDSSVIERNYNKYCI
jgi:hypothetical protein